MHQLLFRFITLYSKYPKTVLGYLVLGIIYGNILPDPLFKDPRSTVLFSSDGQLLNAQIAKDGQWRFPEIQKTPLKFETCIIEFEDAYFNYHWGFNPVSIVKAFYENSQSNKIKRGGSTITQQVIRLSRKNKKRTYFEKLIEIALSTRVEFSKSKDEILKLYASYAPFGGNVVGIEAASWRYFNRNPEELSWAESATLAVLPNAPSLIYPGKNQIKLKQKRNRLLKKLKAKGIIDQVTYELACLEELPQKPHPLPQLAPHLLTNLSNKKSGRIYNTTIDYDLQLRVNSIINQHYTNRLKHQHINNAALLVLDAKTRKVLAYVGNTPTTSKHNSFVDNIQSARSTGSILKPILYAAMYDEGQLLPEELIYDVPTQIANFSPLNFDETFSGIVPANLALSQSLNVPAVRLLRDYHYPKFHDLLNRLNFKHFKKPADYYGLSMILGGGECSLWDITKTFAGFTSILNRYDNTIGEYSDNEFCEPQLIQGKPIDFGTLTRTKSVFDAGAIYETFEALKLVNRPKEDASWQYYESAKDIAWKTGTSYGFRDAWAVGTTSDYIVGVWVGNSDGEGRPGITGVKAAAPILFDVFESLPYSKWPPKPVETMEMVELCSISKKLPNPNCPTLKKYVPKNGIKGNSCKFHKKLHLDFTERFQVNRHCYSTDSIKSKVWFSLPPLAEWYHKQKNPYYQPLPAYLETCKNDIKENPMAFIYPDKNTTIYLPRNRFGEASEMVVMVAHSSPEQKIYWYLDDRFISETQHYHTLKIKPNKGEHILTAIDEKGNEVKRHIRIEL